MTGVDRKSLEHSRRLGRISEGRTWRTSTAIPDAICFVAWAPLRFLAWLTSAIMQLTRTIILTVAVIIGAFLVVSYFYVGWKEGALGLVCLVCAGWVAFSVLPTEEARR